MKIKVLHVLGGLGIGGTETLLLNILKNIDRNRYIFDIVIHHPEQDDYKEEFEKLGANIFVCPSYKLINHNQYTKWWKSFLKEHKYDIIHGHSTSTSSIYLRVAHNYGIKTISHIHSDSYGSGPAAIIKTILQKYTFKYADKLIGCSKQANEFIYGKKLVQDNRCFVLKNGINVTKYQFNIEFRETTRSELGIKENEFVLGTVGRISSIKNPFFIVKILKQLSLSLDHFKFIWVGKGNQEKRVFKALNKNKLLDRILRIPQTDKVEKYLATMDGFIFPSLKEGLGISLVEAQANGLKCFVSDRIPSEAIITDLVEVISLKENAKTWANIIKYKQSTSNRIGYNNVVKNNGYDITNVSLVLSKIYDELKQ